MKPSKSSSHSTPLSDLIEIIRDPQQPSTSDNSYPIESDDSNPLYTLGRLVEQLEQMTNCGSKDDLRSDPIASKQASETNANTFDIERYIDLFQKQSAVLRKILPKLH
jgi:hypothetical protein